ncbi:MAG: phage tail sheath family protein [Nannocystaceae bacterium]
MPTWDNMTPGIYRELVREVPDAVLRTGSPVFLGVMSNRSNLGSEPIHLYRWSQFQQSVDVVLDGGYLADTVRGFFDNGGRHCVILPAKAPVHTAQELSEQHVFDCIRPLLPSIETLEESDLLCVPDLMLAARQGASAEDLIAFQLDLVAHAHRAGSHFSILDIPHFASVVESEVIADARQYCESLYEAIRNQNASWLRDVAVYFPWIRTSRPQSSSRFIPCSGHVAGVYARTDAQHGVFRAPAGMALEDVCDLGINLDRSSQIQLMDIGLNGIRAFRGRGIRLWGARTLSRTDPWRFISVRRLFRTIARWIELRLADIALEPNNPLTWNRVHREVGAYLSDLHAQGALKGAVATEAFYVKGSVDQSAEIRALGGHLSLQAPDYRSGFRM